MKPKRNFKNITLEHLAAIVSEKLRKHSIDSVLVGGGCVSIYSCNRYESFDLDYVTHEDVKQAEKALLELGFHKKAKHFSHPDCQYYIEFVSPPVAIGNEPIQSFEHYKTSLGTIKMLLPTDSVKDRLASFFHWDDKQSLDQAIAICVEIPSKINLKAVEEWSKKENQLEKFHIFNQKLQNELLDPKPPE